MDRKKQIQYAFVKLMDEHDTQGKELAAYIGVKPSSISNYRNGTRSIDIDVLDRICDYYHISLADFLDSGLHEPDDCAKDTRFDELVTLWQTMDDRGRDAILALARSLSVSKDSEVSEQEIA